MSRFEKIKYAWSLRWRIAKLFYFGREISHRDYAYYKRMLKLHLSGELKLVPAIHENAIFDHLGFSFINEDDFLMFVIHGGNEEYFESYVTTLELVSTIRRLW